MGQDAIRSCINPLGGLDVNVISTNTEIDALELQGSSGTLSAFGEAVTTDLHIHAGWTFNYNISPATTRSIEVLGGTVYHDGGTFGCVDSGSNANGAAIVRTESCLTYTPGIGGVFRVAGIFDTPQENSTQLIGLGDQENGWYFGYDGLQFGICKKNNGVSEWTYQSAWNIDTRADLNPQMGNVYELKFQWLGFGMQYFSIEDDTGALASVHDIDYANLHTAPSVANPSLPITMAVSNSGNTIPLVVKSSSAMAGTHGEPFPNTFTVPIGHSVVHDTLPSGDNYLFTIANPNTFLGKPNNLYLEPLLLTLSNNDGKEVIFRAYVKADLVGASYVDAMYGVVPMQIDESATSFSGGILIGCFGVSRNSGDHIDLNALFDERVFAGSSITITAEATGGHPDVVVGLTMRCRV